MHPDGRFAWTDRAAMLEFVSQRAFAHIFAADGASGKVIHAPVIVTAAGNLQFHVGRHNRAYADLADRELLISVSGREAYHSAAWYASPNQVPTWHFEAVEVEGLARPMREAELIAHLDLLSETMERRVSPERPWTRAGVAPEIFAALVKAIAGFELVPSAVRGTRKFNQHKSANDRAVTIAGQQAAGRDDIVAAIIELSGAE